VTYKNDLKKGDGRKQQDGFYPPTTDTALESDCGSTRNNKGKTTGKKQTKRKSSRIYIDPRKAKKIQFNEDGTITNTMPLMSHEEQIQYQHEQSLIENLFRKISMVTGVPTQNHAELPIQFDKFVSGNFESVAPHFTRIQQQSKNKQTSTDDEDGSVAEDGGNEDVCNKEKRPLNMWNARVFGITIFLSNDGVQGGQVVFPNMGNFTVEPLMGRAILFPMVTDLVGENEDTSTGTVITVDEADPRIDQGGGYLTEDVVTYISHAPVQKGTKYTVTIFLRRYPNQNQ